MYTIPFQISPHEYSLFVVLCDGNLERIKKYDPATVSPDKLERFVRGLRLKDVIIGYCTPAEEEELKKLQPADVRAFMQKLSRGWAFRPEMGDHDFNYEDQ